MTSCLVVGVRQGYYDYLCARVQVCVSVCGCTHVCVRMCAINFHKFYDKLLLDVVMTSLIDRDS
jgi:hypothetical protein